MLVCLDKNIGQVVASDEPLSCEKYVLCDGRTIKRSDYEKLFEAMMVKDGTYKIPNYSRIIDGVNFYMISE
jgi:hypothetical protein